MVRIELQHTQRRETFSPEPTLQHAAVCAPFRKRDERSAFHVTSTPDRRMVGVGNYDQSLAKDRNMCQDARGRGSAVKAASSRRSATLVMRSSLVPVVSSRRTSG